MKIELGKYENRDVKFNMNSAPNKNIVIFGLPGEGKSVESQKLAIKIADQGGTVVMLDIHQVLSDDEIFWKYKTDFFSYVHETDVYANGISCCLFEPVTHPDGIQEHSIDAICAVIEALDRTLGFGYAQKASLRTAIIRMLEEGTYEKEGFQALDKVLEEMGTSVAEAVRDKLYLLTAHNIFRPGDGNLFIRKGKINIIRLSRFDMGTQEAVAEMILAYIWRLAVVKHFKKEEIFLFIDEFQNLPSGRKSALAQMLSEGRKFGVNLILTTQQLLRSNASAVQQRLMQCGLVLYFRPGADQVRMIAKTLDSENVSDWERILRSLKKGEFVAYGALDLAGHRVEHPLRVSAFEPLCAYIGEVADRPKSYTPERGKTYMSIE